MTLIIKLLSNNINIENDLVFYGLLFGIVGGIGFSLTSKILIKTPVEQGVQTDAGKIYLDKSTEILPDDFPPIHTLSPSSSTETIRPTISKVGIKTKTEDLTPVDTEVIPTQDIVGKVVKLSKEEFIAEKVDQLNALDPFAATPWTTENLTWVVDNLGIVTNLFT
uniref:Uncharacterized protein n=1 Tax=Lactifluus piperatus TaxID=71966 RepID=A0A2Z4M919_9AGAM|nr:hypothetical protein [Lactifluus piperatus]AWX53003.1 hypothetical protein [Lactifluus piperatus]